MPSSSANFVDGPWILIFFKTLKALGFSLCVCKEARPPFLLPSSVLKLPYNLYRANPPFLAATLMCQKSRRTMGDSLCLVVFASCKSLSKILAGSEDFPRRQSDQVLALTPYFAVASPTVNPLFDNVANRARRFFDVSRMRINQS